MLSVFKFNRTHAVLCLALFLLLTSYFSLRTPFFASAQGVNDFVIHSLDAQYELTNEDKQGLLVTTETIKLTFSGQNQGILRAIPQEYGSSNTNPKVVSVTRDGKNEPFITYESNKNLVARIGVAGTYITGEHTYEITYQVENVIRFYNDYDEIFWDVNGDQWLQTFESVNATLDSGGSITGPGVKCFTGAFGSTAQNCETTDGSNMLTVKTTGPLGAGETLTFVGAFEKGYFTPAPWWETYRNFIIVSPLIAFQALIVRSAHKKWSKYGKDYKKRGITVPYFGRPKNMSVMQASYVLENKLTPKHISASIIDLAIRGNIKITEKKERFKTKHELTLLKAENDGLTEDESLLLKELFSDFSVGSSVKLEDKKAKLYTAVTKLTKLIDEKTANKGFYELSPKNASKKIGLILAVALVGMIAGFGLASFSYGLTALTGVVSMIITGVYSGLMTKRSQSGNMMVEHMEGLKLYLNQAEKDRIKQQDAVEAPLSPQSGQPTRDIKFFEKLLPFAVAMGVEKSWAKAFADIYTQPPDWYGGNWNTFSTVALASSLAGTSTATAASFSAPTSSGGSGFSGGGAGDGGGGGGGGGW